MVTVKISAKFYLNLKKNKVPVHILKLKLRPNKIKFKLNVF